MAALGLLLLAAAGLFGVVVALANAGPEHTVAGGVEIFGYTTNMSGGRLFLIGVITGVVGLLGVALMLGRVGRAAKQRKQHKQVVRQADEGASLRAERDRLAGELEQERAARAHEPAPLAAATSPPVSAGPPASQRVDGEGEGDAAYPPAPAHEDPSVLDRLRNRG